MDIFATNTRTCEPPTVASRIVFLLVKWLAKGVRLLAPWSHSWGGFSRQLGHRLRSAAADRRDGRIEIFAMHRFALDPIYQGPTSI